MTTQEEDLPNGNKRVVLPAEDLQIVPPGGKIPAKGYALVAETWADYERLVRIKYGEDR